MRTPGKVLPIYDSVRLDTPEVRCQIKICQMNRIEGLIYSIPEFSFDARSDDCILVTSGTSISSGTTDGTAFAHSESTTCRSMP